MTLKKTKRRKKPAGRWATVRSLGLTVLAVLSFRAFVAEAYVIPSGSMEPSLLVGDRLFVNKAAFGLRVPFTTRWLVQGRAPLPGDVVVFVDPKNPGGDPLIKRVVARGGDTVAVKNGQLLVNGTKVRRRLLSEPNKPCPPGGAPCTVTYEEQLGEHCYRVVHRADLLTPDFPGYRVPPGHLFVMGDNRDDSNDSRFWGPLPRSHLLGRASFIYFSAGDGEVRWRRVLQAVP
jgi:signal peptidase I